MAESGTQTELSPVQRRAIAALLAERDVRAAAKAAQVAERTLFRWLRDPAFLAELRRAEGEAIDEITRRLMGLQAKALDALEESLSDDSYQHAGVRVRASLGLLDSLLKLRELRNLEERLAALERAVGNGKGS